LKIGSGVPELEDPEKWHFPLKAFIALTTVLRYLADCDCRLYNTLVWWVIAKFDPQPMLNPLTDRYQI